MILVTGADGFVGRSVGTQLSGQNLDFIGADRHAPEPCDVTDRQELDRLFRKHPIDTVIHLAAMLPSACRRNPPEATRVNVMGSVVLLEAAAAFGVKRFVFGSSISIYGPAQGDIDVYGAGKRYVEICGQNMARAKGLKFVSLRIATVVGPGARHTASPWRSEIFEKLGTGARQRIAIPFGAADILSLVYVEDVASMLILLATRSEVPCGVYDTPAENWRIQDLKQAIEAVDPHVTIDLDDTAEKAAQPLARGATFAADFAWCAAPLTERLAGRLLE